MPLATAADLAMPDAPPPRLRQFDNRELSTIAMLATLHFVVSFAARLLGIVLGAVTGPYAVYLDGIGGEGVPSLLLAAAVTLVPRVGTAALTIATVWLLNVVVTGTFSIISMTMVAVSLLLHELVLGLTGVTLESSLRRPSATLPVGVVVRTALAIGAANGAALYAQYFLSMYLTRYFFPMSYVHAASLVTGLGYGTIGAAIGCVWGFRLRRTMP